MVSQWRSPPTHPAARTRPAEARRPSARAGARGAAASGGGAEPPTGRSLLTDVLIGAVVIAVIAAAIWGLPALTGGPRRRAHQPRGPPVAQPSEVAAASESAVASVAASEVPSPAASVPLPGPDPAARWAVRLVRRPGRPRCGRRADPRGGGRPRDPARPCRRQPRRVPGLVARRDADRRDPARARASSEIVVFDARAAATGSAVEPTVILRSSTIGPFYLSWSPDGRTVSYLAEEPNGLSLRLAPADGSAPIDGSGPGSRVRSGNPFYYDWIGSDRLLAHVGTGADAFLGEMHLDGTAAAPGLATPGSFRPPVVSADAALDRLRPRGGHRRWPVERRHRRSATAAASGRCPSFGMASVAFSPTAPLVASIGPTAATADVVRHPRRAAAHPGRDDRQGADPARRHGHQRLVEPGRQDDRRDRGPAGRLGQPVRPGCVGGRRLRGAVALRRAAPGARIAGTRREPGALRVAAPQEVRVVFVDAASGAIQADAVVEPGRLFVDQYLTYFDQYATSHQLWAPDSSSILIPVDDATGSHLRLVPRAGGTAKLLDGVMGAWSP